MAVMSLPPVTSEKEARAIMGSGLARAELEFVTSVTAPLFWITRERDGRLRVRNGSAFFLYAGGGVFGVMWTGPAHRHRSAISWSLLTRHEEGTVHERD